MLVQARVDHVDIIFVRLLSGKVWLAKTAPPIIVHTCIIFIWSVLGPIYDWERVVEDAISGGDLFIVVRSSPDFSHAHKHTHSHWRLSSLLSFAGLLYNCN